MYKAKDRERIVSTSIVETSKVFKRLAALIIFLSFFTLSLIVLFQIGEVSIKLPIIKKYLWLIELLLILWFASRFAIKNIKSAYFSMYASYLMGASLIIYCSVMVSQTYNYQPTEWLDLKQMFVWFAPVLGINAFWKLVFIWTERKVRPFFAYKMMATFIQDIVIISIVWSTQYLTNELFVEKHKFDLENTTHMLLAFYIVCAIIFVLILSYITTTKYWKFGEYGGEAMQKTMLWNSLMKLGSLTVWFIVREPKINWSMQWWIMAGSAIALMLMLLFFAFNKKFVIGGKIYLFLASSIMMTLAVGMFVMETWWGTNTLSIVSILLVTYTLIYLLNVIIEPTTSWWVSRTFSNVASAIVIYVLIDWAFGDYFGNDISKLPFSISELVIIPLLLGVSVLEASTIWTVWNKYYSITRMASKVIKLQKGKQGVKHG